MGVELAEPVLKRAEIVGVLERVCQELELTDAQFKLARDRYRAVGNYLAEAENPFIRGSVIYPQGSMSLGTTVKPLGREEHDVDLVTFHGHLTPATPPTALKRAVGDRLKDNAQYRDILEEKPRCWRLVYANEFHLDITPSITNPACSQGGELVPEKLRPEWKPSNPKGYRTLFERRASLRPRLRLMETAAAKTRAQVEALPEPTAFKGLLRRTVQLCKRHRDVWFSREPKMRPLSIIITTLAARSYEYCVSRFTYDTELDVFLDVVRHMPYFIERQAANDREFYFIWNETTSGENFAEKWNLDPRLAQAFFAWHRSAVSDFERLVDVAGRDEFAKALGGFLGPGPVNRALASLTQAISAARSSGRLTSVAGVGLSIGPSTGIRVPSNTFFGR